jgi:CRISPR-associated protein Cmr3
MMQLFIAPMDVWLFRDGKPFDAESDHRATSLFPPYPSVMQGVIRSQHLMVKKVDLTKREEIENTVGTADDVKTLRLSGPFLARWDGKQLTRFFPVPADMAAQHDKFVPLQRRKPDISKLLTSAPTDLDYLLYSLKEPTKESPGQWLSEETLFEALKGKEVGAIQSDKLFQRESRFGIGCEDRTRTTREGALYEAEFIRPCQNVGLYVEVEGYDGWPAQGVMRIGGEGRGATYEIITAPALPPLKKELPTRFKVYFATPTYFKRGWLPARWSEFFEGEVKLVAVAVNRYESVGGYDWANNSQKPARRYVPAGSVYYFEANGGVKLRDVVMETRAMCDDILNQDGTITHLAQIGFGQIFIQEVNHV